MTHYSRPDELVFASGAKPGEVQGFPDIPRGWGVAYDQTAGIPPMEWFNALFKRGDEGLRYLLQRGIADWSATEDYPVDAHVQEGVRSGRPRWQILASGRRSTPANGWRRR